MHDVGRFTLAIIKPDAVSAGAGDKICDRIREDGFVVIDGVARAINRSEAEQLYSEHYGKPFYKSLIEFTSSTESVIMIIARDDAVAQWRNVIGATDSTKANKGTIRNEFGSKNGPMYMNAVHGSDSDASAEREIQIFFKNSYNYKAIDALYSRGEIKELGELVAELRRARAKFPGNRFLLAALMEEVGELADAIVIGDAAQIAKEATQVACVAVRIAKEGDSTTYAKSGLIDLVSFVGLIARSFLQRDNVSAAEYALAAGARAVYIKHKGDRTFSDVTDEEAKP